MHVLKTSVIAVKTRGWGQSPFVNVNIADETCTQGESFLGANVKRKPQLVTCILSERRGKKQKLQRKYVGHYGGC